MLVEVVTTGYCYYYTYWPHYFTDQNYISASSTAHICLSSEPFVSFCPSLFLPLSASLPSCSVFPSPPLFPKSSLFPSLVLFQAETVATGDPTLLITPESTEHLALGCKATAHTEEKSRMEDGKMVKKKTRLDERKQGIWSLFECYRR